MGQLAGTMSNAASGSTVEVYTGWSWPCFFFGALWYLVKGVWGIGLLWIVLSIFSGSLLHWVGILFMPSQANRHYRDKLAADGYEFTPT